MNIIKNATNIQYVYTLCSVMGKFMAGEMVDFTLTLMACTKHKLPVMHRVSNRKEGCVLISCAEPIGSRRSDTITILNMYHTY